MSDQGWFIDIDIEVEPDVLADGAIEGLQEAWDGWEPSEGDQEVILIETVAPIFAVAAQAASVAPPALLRAYGTKLLGVQYQEGQSASTAITVTLIDTDAHTIEAGSEFEIDEVAFYTLEDVTNIVGVASIPGIPVYAREEGSVHNGLDGTTTAPITALAFISDITVDQPTAGGTDPQDDVDYQNDLSRQLLLQAKTLVTARDYELWALDYPTVGRAYAEHLGNRNVRVVLLNPNGDPVDAATKTALDTDYTQYQMANNTNTIEDATYTTIDVAYTVVILPGFLPLEVEAAIDAALSEALSPLGWGAPTSGDPSSTRAWLNEPVVYKNVLIDIIADVPGVRRVVDVTITGSAGAPDGAGNWTMAGAVALPRFGTSTPTVVVS